MLPDDFTAVYDEAMAARTQIQREAARLGYAPAEVTTYLRIGETMTFYAMVHRKVQGPNQTPNIYHCTPSHRDAVVRDVQKVLADTLAEMAKDREAYKAKVRDLFNEIEEGEK